MSLIAVTLLINVVVFCVVVGYGVRFHRDHRQRKKEKAFMSEARDALTALESEVTKAETVKQSVVTLVEGLVAEVQTQAAATKDAPTAKELLGLASRLQAMTTSYSEAVVANTPAAPAPEPAPAPAPLTTPDPAPTQPAMPSSPDTSGASGTGSTPTT